jgi:hypothetical protein
MDSRTFAIQALHGPLEQSVQSVFGSSEGRKRSVMTWRYQLLLHQIQQFQWFSSLKT